MLQRDEGDPATVTRGPLDEEAADGVSGLHHGEGPGASARSPFSHRLRNYLFAGIIVAAPISITLFLVWQVLRYFDQTVSQFIPTRYNPETYLPFSLPGIGLLVIAALLTLIGWLAAGLAGRTIMQTGEWLLDRTPIVRGIYGTLKQLFETVLSQSSRSFREVVLIEYPRPGIWSLGFVTGEPSGEIARRHGGDLVSVFVPTTPIPAYGFLMFLPRAEVIRLDMSVEDGMKLVISGGIVMPPERAARAGARSAGSQQPHGVLPLEQVEKHA
jgi:uncharacterized membrane protein